jgi:hypothetical protein
LVEERVECAFFASLRTKIERSVLRPEWDVQEGCQQRDCCVVVFCCQRKHGFEFGELFGAAVLMLYAGGS